MSDRADYIQEFDGVRAISILLVLAAHLLPLGPKILALNELAALLGMSLFFGLSGFLITTFLYRSPDRIGAFFLRRSARILPLLWLYALIVAVLVHGQWDSFFAVVFFTLNYSDPLLLPGLSHLWSICVEFHFYLFIGLTVWIFGRRGLWIIPIAMLAILALRIDAGAEKSIRTLLRVDEIFAGGVVALLWQNKHHARAAAILQGIGKGFWLWIALLLASCYDATGPLMYLRPVFGLCVLAAVLQHQEGPIRRFLRWGSLAYIARISYALYIWHPLFRLGWLGERDSTAFFYGVQRPIAIALSFLFAHTTTFTIERFFINRARALEGRLGRARPRKADSAA